MQITSIDINFEPLEEMFPYSEERSVFSMRICGTMLAEHAIKSIRLLFPQASFKIQLNDPHIVQDNELNSYFQSIDISDRQNVFPEQSVSGNRLFLTKDSTLEIKFPWHLLVIMSHLLSKQNAFCSPTAIIEEGVDIQGNVHIGSGTKICRGSVLRGNIYIGSNCLVGFNSVLRGPCSIEDDCKLGHGVEIKNAIIQRNTLIGPLCYVGDSIIGAFSSLGALTRTSNFRLDRKAISVCTKQGWINSGSDKLGCFIGEHVQIGTSVVTLPGVIVGNNTYIGPQVIVNRNLDSHTRYYVKQQLLSIPNSFFIEQPPLEHK